MPLKNTVTCPMRRHSCTSIHETHLTLLQLSLGKTMPATKPTTHPHRLYWWASRAASDELSAAAPTQPAIHSCRGVREYLPHGSHGLYTLLVRQSSGEGRRAGSGPASSRVWRRCWRRRQPGRRRGARDTPSRRGGHFRPSTTAQRSCQGQAMSHYAMRGSIADRSGACFETKLLV